jgi:alpha-N-arabinofuranosidase
MAGADSTSGGNIWKGAVYNTTADVDVTVTFAGAAPGTRGQLTVLTGPENPYGYNDPFTQVNVVKTNQSIIASDSTGKFSYSLPALSVAVLDTNKALTGCGSTKKRAMTLDA